MASLRCDLLRILDNLLGLERELIKTHHDSSSCPGTICKSTKAIPLKPLLGL
jgi:hypothetical protein